VDEVNLLDDHLVDVLLDSAASGWNTVEREGVSVRHPARFGLIGSGNPEEGELRPQLLDRFGMSVEVKTVRDAELRVQVVDQRTSFDDNPDEFSLSVEKQQDELQQKVIKAQEILNSVQMDDDLRLNISAICGELDVDGLRGDIVTNRSARAIAAFEGRTEVHEDDIARVISCSLRHRLRKDPLEQVDSGERVIQAFCKVFDLDEKENFSKLFFFDFLPFIIILKIQYWFIRLVKSYPGIVQGEINIFSDSSLSIFLEIRLISFSSNSLIKSLCKILFLLSSPHNLIT